MASRFRARLRRLLAIAVVALGPFVAGEIALRLAGYPPGDPYLAGFAGEKIFVRHGGFWQVPAEERRTWRAQPFAVERPAGALRIFSVGDSVTWGFGGPRGTPLVSYSEDLQALLRERAPGRPHRVINCGARTFGSERVASVVHQVASLSPDAVLVYVGTSDLLEAKLHRSYERRLRDVPTWIRNARLLAWMTQVFRHLLPKPASSVAARDPGLVARFVPQADILDRASQRRALVERFRANLLRMVDDCEARHVPLVLATVPSNLRFPPFATSFPNAHARAAGEDLIRRTGRLVASGRATQALALLTPAVQAEPQAAGLHYRRAQALDLLGQTAQARLEYLAARDTDAFPIRASSAFNDAIRSIANAHPGVYLADVAAAFDQAVPDHIPDGRLFLDNCHPRAQAHRLVARVFYHALRQALGPTRVP